MLAILLLPKLIVDWRRYADLKTNESESIELLRSEVKLPKSPQMN